MKWIKASERLPSHSNDLHIKIEGTKSTGHYSTFHEMFINDSGDFFPSDQIEWLDESAPDMDVASVSVVHCKLESPQV